MDGVCMSYLCTEYVGEGMFPPERGRRSPFPQVKHHMYAPAALPTRYFDLLACSVSTRVLCYNHALSYPELPAGTLKYCTSNTIEFVMSSYI